MDSLGSHFISFGNGSAMVLEVKKKYVTGKTG